MDLNLTIRKETNVETEVVATEPSPNVDLDVENPFKRRSVMARTPPQGRISSPAREPSSDAEPEKKENEKRKRVENSPSGQEDTEKSSKKSKEARVEGNRDRKGKNAAKIIKRTAELIDRLRESVENLHDITKNSRNTRVEIKEIAEDMAATMKKLVAKDIGSLEIYSEETRTVGTQVNANTRRKGSCIFDEDTTEVISVEGVNSLEKFREVRNKKWNQIAFSCTNVMVGGNILNTEDGTTKVILNLKGKEDTTNNKVWERFPELRATQEDFAVLERTTKIKTGTDICASQKIIKIISEDKDEALWKSLTSLKGETRGDKRIAITHPRGKPVEQLRKMIECIYFGAEVNIDLYVIKEEQTRNLGVNGGRKTAKDKRGSATYALIVEGKEKQSFTEVLKKVKDKVNDSTSKKNIQSLRSTRDGRLLITLDKDKDVTMRVHELLGDLSDTLKVYEAGKRERDVVVHVRGLDALSTKQDVIEAVERKLGPLTGRTHKISELRPNMGNTMAATLVLTQTDAMKLMEGPLRVGCVTCSLEERIQLSRCVRCWSYDHRSRECESNTDRSRLCYKCGEGGHTANACPNQESCPVCGTPGHKADSNGCPLFRTALRRAREERKRRKLEKSVIVPVPQDALEQDFKSYTAGAATTSDT